MTPLPFVCTLSPGGRSMMVSGMSIEHSEYSLATVWFLLPRHAPFDRRVYWEALRETQDHFGRPVVEIAQLDAALEHFRAEVVVQGLERVCVATSLAVDGTVIVSGRALDARPDRRVEIAQLPARDDLLSPTSDWQRTALVTNARAQIDAFRRYLGEHGADDAVVIGADGALTPVLGALMVARGDVLHVASPSTTHPPLIPALMDAGMLIINDLAHTQAGVTVTDIAKCEGAWWLSPEFELFAVGSIADTTMRASQDFAHYALLGEESP